MAKTKVQMKSSSFLCCFGISSSSSSLPHKTPTQPNIIEIILDEEDKNLKQKRRFPWQNIQVRMKGQSTKTMLLEGSESDEKDKYLKLKDKANNSKVHHHSSKWRSKSNLHNNTAQHKIIPITQNQNSSESQETPSSQNSEKTNADNNTCQKSSSPPPTRHATSTAMMSHAVSLPTSKRQVRRLLSSLQAQPPQTTHKQPTKYQNAKRHYNAVVGACVVMLVLVMMILWGRFCAILCTSLWLYFVPRFRLMNLDDDDENDVVENGINTNNNCSNDLDLDSLVYKKKVVLEGLLQRNHSSVL